MVPLKNGITSAYMASSNGHFEVVKFIYETCGQELMEVEWNGRTCASIAERNGHAEIHDFLVQAGAPMGTDTSTHESVIQAMLDEVNTENEWQRIPSAGSSTSNGFRRRGSASSNSSGRFRRKLSLMSRIDSGMELLTFNSDTSISTLTEEVSGQFSAPATPAFNALEAKAVPPVSETQ